MGKSQSKAGAPKPPDQPRDSVWTALTWDDLDRWAGSRSVTRGRAYQRGGRVKDLRLAADGALLATVAGTYRYATTVSLSSAKTGPSFQSACTCPIGGGCKHAIAVVAEYLDAVANNRNVPLATPDDPRWTALEEGATGDVDSWDEEQEDWDEDERDEDDEEEEEEEEEDVGPVRKSRDASGRRATQGNWDEKIERHIRAKPATELADLVWSLTKRFPEVYREFRERISLAEGDAKQLVAEARREIRKVTAETGWQNHWSDEGHTPDYSRIRHRLVRLLESGHPDDVVALGRELIDRGLQQVSESHDEGETAAAFAECLPTVFEAVNRSKLSPSERLLFAIDAMQADDYDVVGEASAIVLDAPTRPEDWSAVADALTKRLKASPAGKGDEYSFSRNYERDGLTNWIAEALEKAGRGEELLALYEAEVRTTGSYERLVAFLLEQNRVEDAERWAREGIDATIEKLPGIAAGLAARLCEVAKASKRWDVVAAHAAHHFFEHPSAHGFDELMKAARKAKVEEAVRAAAQRFLETGTKPFRLPAPRPATPPPTRTKPTGRKSVAATLSAAPKPTAPVTITTDPNWPLPVPDHLIPLLKSRGYYDPEPRSHLDVLLEMAIAVDRPDEVLHWFDRMRADDKRDRGYGISSKYADRVAEAVAKAYPERALAVYQVGLNAHLPNANPSDYEASVGYLRKLRPLYKTLNRTGEWTALVASIREKYGNRPRFMELLDTLEGRTIVQTVRKSKK